MSTNLVLGRVFSILLSRHPSRGRQPNPAHGEPLGWLRTGLSNHQSTLRHAQSKREMSALKIIERRWQLGGCCLAWASSRAFKATRHSSPTRSLFSRGVGSGRGPLRRGNVSRECSPCRSRRPGFCSSLKKFGNVIMRHPILLRCGRLLSTEGFPSLLLQPDWVLFTRYLLQVDSR